MQSTVGCDRPIELRKSQHPLPLLLTPRHRYLVVGTAVQCREPHDPTRVTCEAYAAAQAESAEAEQRRRAHEEAEAQTAELLQATTRHCPSCTTIFSKDAGCQHMECSTCAHQFCYHCLKPHKPTVAHDLSFHAKECLLWAPPAGAYTHQPATCSTCENAEAFCDARPQTSCTRVANGEMADATNAHCTCRHSCPCDAGWEFTSTCECGSPTACTCGKQHIRCRHCQVVQCRLCQRPVHDGLACLEDRVEVVDCS